MEEPINDDSSHYEISLTAGQAFIAFVLLLFSLAAAFAFGVIIGRGQGDERLVVQKEPAVITESAATTGGNIVELGVPKTAPPATATDTTATEVTSSIINETPAPTDTMAGDLAAPLGDVHTDTAAAAPAPVAAAPAPKPVVTPHPAATKAEPYFAQVLSSSEAKPAENLAAKLIENGYSTAYVDRSPTEKGTMYRVRVKFQSEGEARAAVDKLKVLAKSDVWVTKQ